MTILAPMLLVIVVILLLRLVFGMDFHWHGHIHP